MGYNMIENYIYMYHVDTFIVLPAYPEAITDSIGVSFESSTPMSRSAPIYSYSRSGPRTLRIQLDLHRNLMSVINRDVSNVKVNVGEDYVDYLIKQVQAIALPVYGASEKLVNPPMVALRFGNDIFIKGVVTGDVAVTYMVPILEGDKYAMVQIAFTVSEVDPYDAPQVMQSGSFRGFDSSLERNIWTMHGGGGRGFAANGSTTHVSNGGAIHGGGGRSF